MFKNPETTKWYLELNQTSWEIVACGEPPYEYRWCTIPYSPLYVEYSAQCVVGGNPYECWRIKDASGTLYEFGGTRDSRQCEGNYSAGCYTSVYRYDLNSIQDPHGNKVRIEYAQRISGEWVNSAQPAYMYWGNTPGMDDWRYRVWFNSLLGRPDLPIQGITGYSIPIVAETASLVQLNVEYCAAPSPCGWQLVRRYDFTYQDTMSYLSGDYGGIYYAGTHKLISISQKGSDGASALPPTNFTYQDRQVSFHDPDQPGSPGNPAQLTWPFLTKVENGYGGSVSFQYTQKPTPPVDNVWTRQAVTQRTLAPHPSIETNGTLSGVQRITGVYGNALSFVGHNAYITIPGNSALQLTGPLTISLWAKRTGAGGTIIIKESMGGSGDYWINVSETGIITCNSNGGWGSSIVTDESIAEGPWYHIALTLAADSLKCYLNGVLKATDSSTNEEDGIGAATPVYLGRDIPGTSFFPGSVDDVRIFNRVLDSSEINLVKTGGAVSSGLVGHWQLDEVSGAAALDSSGNGNNGQLTIGPAWVTGKLGQAIALDGVDDHMTIPDHSTIRLTGSLTVTLWAKRTGNGGSIVIKESAGGSGDYWISTGMGTIMCNSNGGWGSADTGVPMVQDTWYHIALTLAPDNLRCYVDGVLGAGATDLDTQGADGFGNATPIYLGRNTPGTGFFTGAIDDVRVFNRMLDSDEVSLVRAGGAVASGLVGHWKLDEGTGATASNSVVSTPTGSEPMVYSYTYTGNPEYFVTGGNKFNAEYRGFRQVKETRSDGAAVEHFYFTTGSAISLSHPIDGNISRNADNLKGREYQTIWYANTGAEIQRRFFDWNEALLVPPSGYINNELYVRLLNQGTVVGSKKVWTRYEYDNYNNLILEKFEGDTAATGDEALTRRYFYPNNSAWIVDKVAQEDVYEGLSEVAGSLRAKQWFYYDGATSVTTPPVKGDLTKEQAYKDSGTFVTTTHTYDPSGNRISTTDANGRTTSFGYTCGGSYPSQVTYPPVPGGTFTESQGWDCRLGRKTSDTDVNGQVTSYEYDPLGRPVKVVRPGDTTTYPSERYGYLDWGTSGQQRVKVETKVSDGDYLWADEYFDGLGRIVQVRQREVSPNDLIAATIHYDNIGRPWKAYVPWRTASGSAGYVIPPTGTLATVNAYDALDRVVTRTGPDGATESHAYTPVTDSLLVWKETVTNPLGHKKSYFSDARGQLDKVQEMDAASALYATTTYTQDVLGRLTQVLDTAGNATTMSYDWLSRKTGMTDPDMGAWSYTYDSLGNLLTQTDARGTMLGFTYDALGRMTEKGKYGLGPTPTDGTLSGGVQWTAGVSSNALSFDGVDDHMTIPDSPTLRLAGSLTVALWVKRTGTGGIIVIKESTGGSGDYWINNPGDGTLWCSSYGGWGAANTGVSLPVGQWHHIALTLAPNDLKCYVDGVLKATDTDTQGADGFGAATPIYLGRNIPGTSFFPGSIDDVRIYNRVLDGGEINVVKAGGTIAGGLVGHWKLDEGAGTTAANSADSGVIISTTLSTYTYDDVAGGNLGKGRRTGMADASGSTAWRYDARGRPTQERRTIDGVQYTTGYTYDGADRLATVTYPTGEVVTQGYDARGMPSTLSGSVAGSLVSSAGYNQLGLLTSLAYGNGVANTFAYFGIEHNPGVATSYGRLRQVQATKAGVVLQDLAHDWDVNGNLTSRTISVAPAETETFTYDFLDRLAGISGAYAETYAYSPIGNITSKNGAAYAYGSPRPHAVTQVGGTAYSYDANGNMTARGAQTLTWNAENRLSAVSGGTSFVYDGYGVRVKKTEGGQTTVYPSRFYEKNVTTGEVTTYYYLGDRLVASRKGSALEYLHQDHLGSTALSTSSGGALAATLRYYAFGGTRASSGTLNTDRQFTGQRLDSTGLYFYNARYYDAGIGRFISPDNFVPDAGNPQDFNRYSYVRNNPLTYADPSGNFCVPCVALVVVAWYLVDEFTGPDIAHAPETTDISSLAPSEVPGFSETPPGFVIGLILPGPKFSRMSADNAARFGLKLGKDGFFRPGKPFRENLMRWTGKTESEVKGLQAHHVLPLKFKERFDQIPGLDINDPRFGTWVEKDHQNWSDAYNKEWGRWFAGFDSEGRAPTMDEVLEQAERMANSGEYSFSWTKPS